MQSENIANETNWLLRKFYRNELNESEKRRLKNMLGILREEVHDEMTKVEVVHQT